MLSWLYKPLRIVIVFLAAKRTRVLLCRTHCKVSGVTNEGFLFEIYANHNNGLDKIRYVK